MGRLVSISALLACLTSSQAMAQNAAEVPSGGNPWLMELQVSAAHLLHTRSSAIGHLFKPQLALSARRQVGHCYEFGATILGLVDRNEHYRVLGLQATARRNLLVGRSFSWGVVLSVGAGYNADILHADLNARAPLAFYGSVASDVRWRIRSNWQVGVRAEGVSLALVNLGLLFGRWF